MSYGQKPFQTGAEWRSVKGYAAHILGRAKNGNMINLSRWLMDAIDELDERRDAMQLFGVQLCSACGGSGAEGIAWMANNGPQREACEACVGDGWESILSLEANRLRARVRELEAEVADLKEGA